MACHKQGTEQTDRENKITHICLNHSSLPLVCLLFGLLIQRLINKKANDQTFSSRPLQGSK